AKDLLDISYENKHGPFHNLENELLIKVTELSIETYFKQCKIDIVSTLYNKLSFLEVENQNKNKPP
ncbi:MAG: hypothetical protein MHPSP_004654, partial [Paramarteilia canceri]